MSNHFNNPYFRYSNDFRKLTEEVFVQYPSQRNPLESTQKGERGYYANDFTGYYPNSSDKIYNFSFPDLEEEVFPVPGPITPPPSSD